VELVYEALGRIAPDHELTEDEYQWLGLYRSMSTDEVRQMAMRMIAAFTKKPE
jgi:hypothetical protein